MTTDDRYGVHDRVFPLRAKLTEAALAWQLAVDDERRGYASPAAVNMAAITLYKATKAYRAATR